LKKQLTLFIKDSIWYSLKPFLTKLFNFVLVPIYTAHLTPDDYGNLQYILAFGAFFRAVINLGLDSSYWKYKLTDSGYPRADVTLNFTLMQLLAGISILIISCLIKFYLFSDSKLALFIIIFFIAETIRIVFLNIQTIYRANHKPKMYIFGMIIQSLIFFLLNFLFVVVFKKNFYGIIYSYLICYFIISLIFIHVLIRESKGKINIPLSKEMLNYGIPIMIGNISAFIITLSDRFFLKEFSSMYELGLYSYGYKYSDLVRALLINTFFLAWNPIRWDIYEMKDGKNIFSKFNRLLFIVIPFFSAIIMGFSLIIASILTVEKEFLEGIKIVFIIGFSHVLFGLYYFSSMGMLFTNKTGRISFIIIISGITNLIFNFILIPLIGMLGAAIATIISYFVMFLLGRFYCQKYYPITRNKFFEISQVIIIFSSVIILTYLTYIISNLYLLAGITFLTSILILAINLLFKNIRIADIIQFKTLLLEARKKKDTSNLD